MTISKREYKMLILGAIVTGLLYSLAFNYVDGRTYTIWSVDFLDCLLEGRLSEFYAQTVQNRYDLSMERSYSQFWYLAPASLWNIPLWIAEKYFSVNLMHPLALFWGKLWFLLLQILVGYQVYRSAPKRKLLAAFLTISSIFAFISAGYAGQNDLYWIFFSLLALSFYREDRLNVFIGLSLYIALVKPFWIFPFVALYLIRDKRIYRLILWLMAYVGAQLLHMLLMGNLATHSFSNPAGAMTLRRILTTITVPTPFGGASVLLLVFLAIYLWAYLYKPESDDGVTNNSLFPYQIVSAVFLLLILLSQHDFYRYVLPVPYVAILLASKEDGRWPIIATTATESFLAWFLIARGTYIFQPIFMEGSGMGLPPIDLDGRRFYAPYSLFRVFYESETLRAGVMALMIAAVAVTYFLYRGDLKLPEPPKYLYRITLWARALIIPVMFFLLTLMTYFIPAKS